MRKFSLAAWPLKTASLTTAVFMSSWMTSWMTSEVSGENPIPDDRVDCIDCGDLAEVEYAPMLSDASASLAGFDSRPVGSLSGTPDFRTGPFFFATIHLYSM